MTTSNEGPHTADSDYVRDDGAIMVEISPGNFINSKHPFARRNEEVPTPKAKPKKGAA